LSRTESHTSHRPEEQLSRTESHTSHHPGEQLSRTESDTSHHPGEQLSETERENFTDLDTSVICIGRRHSTQTVSTCAIHLIFNIEYQMDM
jgi:hypothetical protein